MDGKNLITTFFVALHQFIFLLWHVPGLIVYSTYFLWINKHWIFYKKISQARSSFLEQINKSLAEEFGFLEPYIAFICKNFFFHTQKKDEVSRFC